MTLVDTAAGPAAVQVELPAGAPSALVVLGHGAGGHRADPVLERVAAALVEAGVAVARFDQPYRVAGRRAPAPALTLDGAAVEVVEWLTSDPRLGAVPLVVGGKSSGARVACRTAVRVGATGVVALGFPLRPPGRPDRDRAAELCAAGRPVLVCQGTRDVFGSPTEVRAAAAAAGANGVTVHTVAGGDHSFVARRRDGRTTTECRWEVADVTVRWVLGQIAAT